MARAKPKEKPGRDPLRYNESVEKTLRQVAAAYPDVKLVALGQTVLWDEPMKATLRRALDDFGIGLEMVLGVHDTDYFSKLPHQVPGKKGYRILPHNDGSTRGFWTSAGEISEMFGSETVVTRDRYLEYGVPFDKLARDYPGGRQEFIDRMTEAWGWRGIASNGVDSRVTAELPLSELASTLTELSRWAFERSANDLTNPDQRSRAEAIAKELQALLAQHVAAHPTWTLSDFYQHLLPHLYELLLGYKPEHVSVGGTYSLTCLKRDTAHLPRFELLDHFLRPETRAVCEEAYNACVTNGPIYNLPMFGPGALPFDLVIPGRGRGTLRITDNYVVVMTPRPFFRSLRSPICSVGDLAAWIEETFGEGVAVMGKAITFVAMMAREFLFVFHEGASNYVWRTRRMNDILRTKGIELPQHPILRIRYATWDALDAVPVWMRLPEHLAASFGQEEIHGPSFAQRWQSVVEEQRELLKELSTIHRPRELIRALHKRSKGSWDVLAEQYDRLHLAAQEMQKGFCQTVSLIRDLFDEWRAAKAEYSKFEKAKGNDFRATLWPLIERRAAGEQGIEDEIERQTERRKAEFEVRLALLRQKIRDTRDRISELRKERLDTVRSSQALSDRDARHALEREAELARARLVRYAVLTADGLTSTHHRPTAWWLPMFSKDGAWFRQIAETAEMYLEELYS